METPKLRKTPLQRFFSKIRISSEFFFNETPCWEWLGSLCKGYPQFWSGPDRHGKMVRAHRWAYNELIGQIPCGLDLDHLCKRTWCVNPDHMEPVTEAVNIMRGQSPSAKNAMKVFCKRGHLLSGSNVVPSNDGNRRCRACIRQYNKDKWKLHKK